MRDHSVTSHLWVAVAPSVLGSHVVRLSVCVPVCFVSVSARLQVDSLESENSAMKHLCENLSETVMGHQARFAAIILLRVLWECVLAGAMQQSTGSPCS